MKDVQCYELFGGIALKDHAFSFSILDSFGLQGPNCILDHCTYVHGLALP